ncbi:MAG: LPS export ABC transporter permease LptF [Gammaproteobacteria bacterium]|nr:LPS export ABC transporter permease LptF [Gammaproteobacteria bacterium]
MIIERYLFKELFGTLIAVTTVLFLIFVSTWFARLLGQVAAGDVNGKVLFLLLALKSLDALVILLPLALYLAVLLALGRLYKDNEMAAMFACGVSPLRVAKLVFWVALGFSLVVSSLSLFLGPWANAERFRLSKQMESTSGLEMVVGGQFRELSNSKLVFYAERLADDGINMENVFIQQNNAERQNVIVAPRAQHLVDPVHGGSYLVLEDGYRYEGNPGSADFRVIEFKRHGVRVKESEIVSDVSGSPAAMSTLQLMQAGDLWAKAEVQWRWSMPVSTVLLAMLAVFLSRTNPRQGRFAKFFVGILVYVIYNNTLSVARSWLEKGSIPPQYGLWIIHALVAAVIVIVLIMQAQGQLAAARLRRAAIHEAG